jgi:hypothetical protein
MRVATDARPAAQLRLQDNERPNEPTPLKPAMSTFAEYNPLHSLRIPGLAGSVEAKGLIVIIGPNSSGKTLLLKDIEDSLIGMTKTPIVYREILFQRPVDANTFFQDLERQQLIQYRDPAHVRITQPHYGRGTRATNALPIQELLKQVGDIPSRWLTNEHIPFFASLGSLFLTSLFLENRLLLYVAQGRFDGAVEPPANDLQALFLNRDAQERLEKETGGVFGNAVWLDQVTAHNQFWLIVD